MPVGIYKHKQLSKEHKRKISLGNKESYKNTNRINYIKGKHFSPKTEFKKGMTPWSKGLTKENDERIRKISELKIGKKRSNEVKQKFSLATKNSWKKYDNMGMKGKNHSEETKRRLSESHKGKISPMYGKHHSKETKDNISLNLLKRYKDNPELLENLRKINIGKKQSKETIEKRRLKISGDKCHLWKGGITPINHKIRTSLEYKLWRKSVFERDNYTCIFCGKRGGIINADHIKPFALFPELRFAIDNGRTLCIDCHRKTETYGRKND